jgi:ribonuclease BN (tRNA processing enzyme)
MKLKVIGCGSALDTGDKLGNQSFILEDQNWRLLIDCGRSTPEMLKRANIDPASITAVYISHLHNDHIGGLEWLGFTRYDWLTKPKHYSEFKNGSAPILIGNEQVIKDLWDHSLKGGMNSMAGFESNLETFFNAAPVSPNDGFCFKFDKLGYGESQIDLVQQVHIMAGNIILPSYGLFIKGLKKKVYLTTDAQYFQPEQVRIFYDEADIIIQDCECIGVDTENKKMDFKSGVHANYAQLAGWDDANAMKLGDDIKKKVWLSHYQSFVAENKDYKGNYCDWQIQTRDDGLAGFVYVGQEFEL